MLGHSNPRKFEENTNVISGSFQSVTNIENSSSFMQSLKLVDNAVFGRLLYIDGISQSAENDEFVYHESLVHPAMLAHSHPTKVFIGGGGEGATLREVLRHKSVQKAVMVDIDGEMIKIAKEHLTSWHQGSFEDPRTCLAINDASLELKNFEDGYFDVVILDFCDPLQGGPAWVVYSKEFYSLVKSKMSIGGILAVQSGPCQLFDWQDCFGPINYSLTKIFTHVHPSQVFVPSFTNTWGFNLCSDAEIDLYKGATSIDKELQKRLTDVNKLRFYDGISHPGLFSTPKFLRLGLKSLHEKCDQYDIVIQPEFLMRKSPDIHLDETKKQV